MKKLAPTLYKTYDCLLCGKMSLTPACAECDDFVENLCKTTIEEKPELKRNALGFTKKGIYMHNPGSGFNELINKNGDFTNESPY
jgi:hypothetical protein